MQDNNLINKGVRLPKWIIDAIDKEASKRKTFFSEIVREILERHCAEGK